MAAPPAPKKAGQDAIEVKEPTTPSQQELKAAANAEADQKALQKAEEATRIKAENAIKDHQKEVQQIQAAAEAKRTAKAKAQTRQEFVDSFITTMNEDSVQTYKDMSDSDKRAYEKQVRIARRDRQAKEEHTLAALTLNTERLAKKTAAAMALQQVNEKRFNKLEERQAADLQQHKDEMDVMRARFVTARADYEQKLKDAVKNQKEKEQERTEERAAAAAKKRQAAADKAEEVKAASAKKRKKAGQHMKLPLEHDVLEQKCDTHGCDKAQQGGACSWANFCSCACKFTTTSGSGFNAKGETIDANRAKALAEARAAREPPSTEEKAAIAEAAEETARQQAAQSKAAASAKKEAKQARAAQREQARADEMRRNAVSPEVFMANLPMWIEAIIGCCFHPGMETSKFNPDKAPHIQSWAHMAKLGHENMPAAFKMFMIPVDYDYQNKNFQAKASDCAAHHMLSAFKCGADEVTEIVTAILRHATANAAAKNPNLTPTQNNKIHRTKLEEIIVAAFKGETTKGLHSIPEEEEERMARAWDVNEKQERAATKRAATTRKRHGGTANRAMPQTGPKPKRNKGSSSIQNHCGVLYIGGRCKRTDCPCTATYNGRTNEFCCITCREGERCDKNYHRRPIEAPGDCEKSAMLYSGPACINKHCHCIASWNGREGEYCSRACKQGRHCAHNVHTTPVATKLWWRLTNLA